MRLFHWTLVVAFTVAYLTDEDRLTVHVWAGYLVGGLIVARVIWGFVGPVHARFSDFLSTPAQRSATCATFCCFAPNAISATARAEAPWSCCCW